MRKWRVALALVTLRNQVNAKWPNRDKASDGSIGDAAHAARTSDHNPWITDKKGFGVVSAIDIDADLSPVESVKVLVDALFASRDPRIKYLIFNGKITQRDSHGIIAGWIDYHGVNAHKHHMHISVKSDPKSYDSTDAWDI